MEYGKPQKLPDGRYFLKISGAQHQVNGVVLQDPLVAKSINLKLADQSLFDGIDTEILTKAKELKQEWFGKELSDETIQNAYQESVTDGSLGATLYTIKGNVVSKVYDSRKNPVEPQEVKAETKCDVILELSGLWFLKKSFGPIWRVIQVRVRGTKVAEPEKYLFNDEVADEDEDDPTDYLD